MGRRQCLLVLSLAVVVAAGLAPSAAWWADKPFEPFMGAWMNVSGLVGRSDNTSARESSIAENLDQFKMKLLVEMAIIGIVLRKRRRPDPIGRPTAFSKEDTDE